MKSVLSIVLFIGVLSIVLDATPSKEPLFKLRTPAQTGVTGAHVFDEKHRSAYLYYTGTAVGGICLGDVNNDSVLDIYRVGAAGENSLWIGDGALKFRPSPQPSLNGQGEWGTGAALVDIDNDGDLDLYQCYYNSPNRLYLNDGKGNFSELKGAAGLDVKDASFQPAFADADNDGDLDLFLLCNELHNPKGRPRQPHTMKNGVPVIKPEYRKYLKIAPRADGKYKVSEYGRRDYLFINQSTADEIKFVDVSEKSGACLEGFGLSSIWWDYDMDGDLDLYVANDFNEPDRLFRNDGANNQGVPTFKNIVSKTMPSTTWSSMGSDFADLNNDGLPDLMVAEMASNSHYTSKTNMGPISRDQREVLTTSDPRQYMRNHFFTNTGAGMFQESAFASGLSSTNWSWTIKFGDLDNDGQQDVFITNGIIRNYTDVDYNLNEGSSKRKENRGKSLWEIKKGAPPRPEKNVAFQNLNGYKFKKRPDWGLGLLGMSYSSAMGDLDNDGDLDLVVSDLAKETKIYENQSKSGTSLRITLKGTKSNKMGIGARIVVTDNQGTKRTRWMNPFTGFLSQNDSIIHVGMGESKPTKVEIYWPSGIYQDVSISSISSNSLVVTERAEGKRPVQPEIKLRFVKAKAPGFIHKEKPYDDFKIQPLLPQKLSQLGPCLAKGDIDNDGDQDLFIGGAHKQAGAIYLNNDGAWVKSEQEVLNGLAKYSENTAAVWFDADGDNDLDLLVISGSNEYAKGDLLYKDRLYINQLIDGKVTLESAPDGAFPEALASGSCVAVADYDKDGDLDVFIGSRSIPGEYPLTPKSRLLRNDSAAGTLNFTEITPENIKNVGMVTDALWADLDNDKIPELVIATDWGPVKVFSCRSGKFTEISDTAGTSQKLGWWRSIHAVDIDNDGDLDLIAGNSGLNTKYKTPSSKYPSLLYYGDLDGSGKTRIVEAKIQKDKDRPLPVRGRY